MESSAHGASIFVQIGGAPAVTAAVDAFYERVLADPNLVPYFVDVPLARLKGHQVAFFTAALGGPARYEGRAMAEAHAPFAITQDAFDRVATHLSDTLAALGVSAPLVDAIISQIAPLREAIVSERAA